MTPRKSIKSTKNINCHRQFSIIRLTTKADDGNENEHYKISYEWNSHSIDSLKDRSSCLGATCLQLLPLYSLPCRGVSPSWNRRRNLGFHLGIHEHLISSHSLSIWLWLGNIPGQSSGKGQAWLVRSYMVPWTSLAPNTFLHFSGYPISAFRTL